MIVCLCSMCEVVVLILFFFLMIRRPPRSTQSRSSAASDVYKRQSHRLSEIISIADKVTVMRDGRDVGTENIENISLDQIITMMIGRTMDEMYPKLKVNIGEPILQVKNLSHRKYFKNVSFEVRRGEIFGIAGLIGAGRTEVIETIFGIRPKSEG